MMMLGNKQFFAQLMKFLSGMTIVVCMWQCQKKLDSAKNQVAPEKAISDKVYAFKVSDRDGLLLTYQDDKGEIKTAQKIADVPVMARKNVRVIDLAVSPEQRGAGKYIYIADLTQPQADGSYPYQVLSAVHYEKQVISDKLERQLKDALAKSSQQVTIYTTQWCGVCARAKNFLREQNIDFVERDVEKDELAQAEVQEKARKSGMTPQGVPIIDVYGTLLLGFDEKQILSLVNTQRKSGSRRQVN